jgi:hypothetical protein
VKLAARTWPPAIGRPKMVKRNLQSYRRWGMCGPNGFASLILSQEIGGKTFENKPFLVGAAGS